MKKNLSKLISKNKVYKLKPGDIVRVEYKRSLEDFIVLSANEEYAEFVSKRLLLREVDLEDVLEGKVNEIELRKKLNVQKRYLSKDINHRLLQNNEKTIWIPSLEEMKPLIDKKQHKLKIHIIPYKFWRIRLVIYRALRKLKPKKKISNASPICFRIAI